MVCVFLIFWTKGQISLQCRALCSSLLFISSNEKNRSASGHPPELARFMIAFGSRHFNSGEKRRRREKIYLVRRSHLGRNRRSPATSKDPKTSLEKTSCCLLSGGSDSAWVKIRCHRSQREVIQKKTIKPETTTIKLRPAFCRSTWGFQPWNPRAPRNMTPKEHLPVAQKVLLPLKKNLVDGKRTKNLLLRGALAIFEPK